VPPYLLTTFNCGAIAVHIAMAVVYWPGKMEIDYGLKSWFYGLTWSIFSAVEQLES